MNYQVATIVSVLLGALLIGGVYVHDRHTQQGNTELAANISGVKIRQLATLYWECQDQSANDEYQRSPGQCAVIARAMQRRVNEMPALEVVKVHRYDIPLPMPRRPITF